MSWDKNERTEKCPCGNGTYTVTTNDSGWKETERWHMSCPDCGKNYVLYEGGSINSGRPVWVKKDAYDSYVKAQKSYGCVLSGLVKAAREKGSDTWDLDDMLNLAGIDKKNRILMIDDLHRQEALVGELENEMIIEGFV